MSLTLQLTESKSADLFKSLAEQMGMNIGEFWFEIQSHLIQYPSNVLSEYLVKLARELENPENGATKFFDTKIQSAAIMLETLDGRVHAFETENARLQALLEEAPRKTKHTPRLVFNGMEYYIHRRAGGEWTIIMFPAGESPHADAEGMYAEHTQVHILQEKHAQPRYAIEPSTVKGDWKLTIRGRAAHEPDLQMRLIEADVVQKHNAELVAEKQGLEDQCRALRIAIENKDELIRDQSEDIKNVQHYQDIIKERDATIRRLHDNADAMELRINSLVETSNNLIKRCDELSAMLDQSNSLHVERAAQRGTFQEVPLDKQESSMVDHPKHYNSHPSGVECWDIVEHMPFNVGTAMKHLWRCDLKHPDALEDLEKAVRYVQREIEKRRKERDDR